MLCYAMLCHAMLCYAMLVYTPGVHMYMGSLVSAWWYFQSTSFSLPTSDWSNTGGWSGSIFFTVSSTPASTRHSRAAYALGLSSATQAVSRSSGEEALPAIHPGLSGGARRLPGGIVCIDPVLFALGSSEGGTSVKTEELVGSCHCDAWISAQRVRVRPVVLAALQ